MQINKSLLRIILLTQVFTGLSACAMQAPQQSLSQYHFKAASVLPVTYFDKGGQKVKYAILGREAGGNDKGTYDDFGGSRDKGEKHPVITAAREFFEEGIVPGTLGWSLADTRKFIDAGAQNTEWVLAHLDGATYVTNFATQDIVKFKKNFHHALAQQTSHKFKEKDRIATVRWDLLSAAITNSKTNTGVQVQARLIDPQTGKDEAQQATITLRPFFTKRMRPLFENKPFVQGKSPKIRFY